ncbi:MAG: TIGR02147 family protein [Deltaproteobacteria bacterium]|nr:TIGR02147 family protein [Deltaproteobacteria bacterium]
MRTHDLPRIYDYLEYRAWLRDAWEHLRAQSRSYSYRWFSRKAGFGSPSYLKHVIDGDRNLSDDTASRCAKAFELGPQEAKYFRALVRMNQAASTEERSQWYDVLSALPPYRETQKLQRSQYDYYARWYCIPIRELVARSDFREDPQWIAHQMRPHIKPSEASEALALLQDLGMLGRDADGRLQQETPLLTTGPELRLLSLRRFHQQMLRRAEEAMDQVPLPEREVGGVTLRLTESQVRHLKQRLFELRQEVLQLDGAAHGDQAVHHFAFQLFPVTSYPSAPTGDSDE